MENRREHEHPSPDGAPPALVLVAESAIAGAVRVALRGEPVLIGRDAANHLRNQNLDVSRFHCRVEPREDGRHVLVDSGSTFGTWLDGVRIAEPALLRAGQVIGIGENGGHRIRVEAKSAGRALPLERRAVPLDAERRRVRAILAQVGATLDLESSLATAVETVAETLRAERVVLVLEEAGELVARASHRAADRLAEDVDLPVAALKRAIARAEVRQWIPDPEATDAVERSLLARGVTAAWFLPLHSFEADPDSPEARAGRAFVGVVYAETRVPAPVRCDRETLDFLAVLADVVALQLANARHYHRATYDALTGLRNRSWLDECADRLLERRSPEASGTLILADIDDFRRLNETWGHDAGDQVLREIAARFRDTVRVSGTPCRHGGEELAVILPDHSLDAAVALAERLRAAVAERPVKAQGSDGRPVEIAVTASFGVVELDRATMPRRADFIKAAGRALARAQAEGRNRVARG